MISAPPARTSPRPGARGRSPGQWDDASGTDARRQARIGYDNALSQYTQAQGNVADLGAQIAQATLVAPADGTVDAVTAVAGADISGGPAITLVSGPLQATADFTESDLPSLEVGQAATVTVDAIDASVSGKVVAIAPSSASSSGSVVTYAVTIELTGAPDAARPGMSAKASVTIAQATNVLAVPAVALNGSALGYTVLVLDQTAPPSRATSRSGSSPDAGRDQAVSRRARRSSSARRLRRRRPPAAVVFPGGGFQRGNGGNGRGGTNDAQPQVTNP